MQPRFGPGIRELLEQAIQEDIGNGDHTSLATIPEKLTGSAEVRIKSDGILAGVEAAVIVLEMMDSSIRHSIFLRDGSRVSKGDIAMEISGNVRSLLRSERLILNIMQRMSGIATLTRQYSEAVKGTSSIILDTRKTTPNFRLFEKWAVHIGGGRNHRYGLYDMILIKDNHIDAAGGIANAISGARDYVHNKRLNLKIEIEVRNFHELDEVLKLGGVDRIMLDNFLPSDLREAVLRIGDKFETEASGGILLENVKEYAAAGVNYISVGALTHSYRSMDISMKMRK